MKNKALKFDDADEELSLVKIPNADDSKSMVNRLLKLEEEKDQANADLKAAYENAKNQGFDTQALKTVVKYKKKPPSLEKRQAVNDLMTKIGEQIVFAFV